jgi:hypothetical protein
MHQTRVWLRENEQGQLTPCVGAFHPLGGVMSLLHKCILSASTSSARTDKLNIINGYTVRPEPVEG